MDDCTKAIPVALFVVIVLAVVAFSGFRAFRRERDAVQGHFRLCPDDKQGEVQRQNQHNPGMAPSPATLSSY